MVSSAQPSRTRTVLTGALFLFCLSASAQLNTEVRKRIDSETLAILERTGVPSASIGIVQNGQIVLTAAYGKARLSPELDATSTMRYAVGSITKQFTATAILLLAEDGKLTLDDPVGKYFPQLTQANAVTIRNLLSHTSGYEDYAPQDYTIPPWTAPAKPLDIVNEWARKPLDFPAGTQWQYSNTNFVLAGLIVEKASGMSYPSFLEKRILQPLGMKDVIDLDTDRNRLQVTGYYRNALGPLRVSPLEAPGWYFADGNLAMPITDLMTWDIALMQRELLKPASYEAMETETILRSGAGTSYGLGIHIDNHDGHRRFSHTGEISGFVAANVVYPDDKLAIAVLTNQEANSAASSIADAIAAVLLAKGPDVDTGSTEPENQARAVLTALQHGSIDPKLLTDDAKAYFSPEAIHDFATSLTPLGEIVQLKQISTSMRGGMVFRMFRVTYRDKQVILTTFNVNDGRYEQFLVEPAS